MPLKDRPQNREFDGIKNSELAELLKLGMDEFERRKLKKRFPIFPLPGAIRNLAGDDVSHALLKFIGPHHDKSRSLAFRQDRPD